MPVVANSSISLFAESGTIRIVAFRRLNGDVGDRLEVRFVEQKEKASGASCAVNEMMQWFKRGRVTLA
jgi:hypothetical protein